jgi:N,N'-diacetylchitobiose transport system substrate-binding protein
MKARIIGVVALAAALAVAASTASARTEGAARPAAANKIVVWLMSDAQNGWPTAVEGANNTFKAQHPGVELDIQYQSWNDVLQKFEAALAAGNAPDVIELGNTQTTKYMAAGAFAQLNASAYPNSKTWLRALKQSVTYNGKLYGVPYYAGARAVI